MYLIGMVLALLLVVPILTRCGTVDAIRIIGAIALATIVAKFGEEWIWRQIYDKRLIKKAKRNAQKTGREIRRGI